MAQSENDRLDRIETNLERLTERLDTLTVRVDNLTMHMVALSDMFQQTLVVVRENNQKIEVMQSQIRGNQTQIDRILDRLFNQQ